MTLNFAANLLGLDNAATPFGLKAMESLQTLNPDKDRASNAQIMFLCLHASGLTLIPVSIIAIRASMNSATPTDIFLPTLIATFCATMAAMIIVSIKQKINLFQPSFSRTLLTTHYSLMIGQHRYVIHHLGRWVHLSGMSTLKHINLCALIDHLGEG